MNRLESWLRRHVETVDIHGEDGSVYLTRWTLASWRGRRLTLHKMHRPDTDLCLHDHPWNFTTLVLWGGYVEQMQAVTWDHWYHCAAGSPLAKAMADVGMPEPCTCQPIVERWNPPGIVRRNRAEHRHRISELPRGTCWTLLVRGPDVREWGFWGKLGWLDWRSYFNRPHSRRVAWCQDHMEQ